MLKEEQQCKNSRGDSSEERAYSAILPAISSWELELFRQPHQPTRRNKKTIVPMMRPRDLLSTVMGSMPEHVQVSLCGEARPLSCLLGAKCLRKGLCLHKAGACSLSCSLAFWIFQQSHGQLFFTQQYCVCIVHLQVHMEWSESAWWHRAACLSKAKEHRNAEGISIDAAHLCAHLISKLVQLLLANNSCVAEPPSVWLDPGVWQIL